jgi:hypothetical protein
MYWGFRILWLNRSQSVRLKNSLSNSLSQELESRTAPQYGARPSDEALSSKSCRYLIEKHQSNQ